MNIWRAVSEHVEADLAEAKQEAADALVRYVAAQQTVMELQSLIELRAAMAREEDVPSAASTPITLTNVRGAA